MKTSEDIDFNILFTTTTSTTTASPTLSQIKPQLKDELSEGNGVTAVPSSNNITNPSVKNKHDPPREGVVLDETDDNALRNRERSIQNEDAHSYAQAQHGRHPLVLTTRKESEAIQPERCYNHSFGAYASHLFRLTLATIFEFAKFATPVDPDRKANCFCAIPYLSVPEYTSSTNQLSQNDIAQPNNTETVLIDKGDALPLGSGLVERCGQLIPIHEAMKADEIANRKYKEVRN